MSDPEPLTPEGAADGLTPDVWFDAAYDELGLASPASDGERNATRCALTALRDMIASLDAEVARLTATVNQQDEDQRKLVVLLGTIRDNQADDVTAIRQRISALDSPTDPETVTVPRSLVDSLSAWHGRRTKSNLDYLLREYDAWKAGQSNG